MDGFKDALYTGGVNALGGSLGAALFEDFVKAIGLHNAHAVYFLITLKNDGKYTKYC